MFVGGKFAPQPTRCRCAAGGTVVPRRVRPGDGDVESTPSDRSSTGRFWDMVVAPSGLVIAGQFTTVGGTPQAGLAVLDPVTGALRPGLVPSVRLICRAEVDCLERPLVRSLDLEGGLLYIGGNFSRVGDKVRSRHLTKRGTHRHGDLARRPGVAADGRAPRLRPRRHRRTSPPRRRVPDPQRRERPRVRCGRRAGGCRTAPAADRRSRPRPRGDRQYTQSVLVVGSKVWQGGSEHSVQVYRESDNALLRGWITGRRGGDSQAIATDGTQVDRRQPPPTPTSSPTASRGRPCGASRGSTRHGGSPSSTADTREYRRDFVPDVRTWNSEGAWELYVDTAGCLWAAATSARPHPSPVNGGTPRAS